MSTTYILSHVTLAGTTEGLNGKHFTLLHLGLVATLDNRNTLATVDDVLVNVVTVEVPDTLDGIHGPVDFNFVTLHGFLDGGTNVAHADVDTRFLHQAVSNQGPGNRIETVDIREYQCW